MSSLIKCPCGKNIADEEEKTAYGDIQHHLWGWHGIEVMRAHLLASKIVKKKELTQEETDELKQMGWDFLRVSA